MANSMSRRDALKMGALSVGVAVLATNNAMATEVPMAKDIKWDEEKDVIIIGSGFAGISGGISAANRGLSVLILEKMGRIGGNSVINGGIFAVPNNEEQGKEGIKDSNELFIKDCLKAGRGLNYTEMVDTIASRAKDAYQLTLKCGAKYVDKMTHAGGHSVPRSFQTANGSGAGIVLPMVEYFKKLQDAEIRTRVKFDNFILDESGKVIGVSVRENYKFDTNSLQDDWENKTGDRKFIKAKKGVILASGGFCRDTYFRHAQDPIITEKTDSTNHPGATAGAMIEAFRIGATPVQLSWIQYGPWACPDEKGFGVGSMFNVNGSFRYGISVNPKTGKRYMNELADRKTRADAMFKVIGEDENYPINLCDSVGVSKIPIEAQYAKPLEASVLKKFDTLDELAKFYKMPIDEFKKTIETYNGYVKSEKDLDFDKPMKSTEGVTISKAPFYAMRGTPKLHHTMGGIRTNTKAQVLSCVNGKPIPGLYAAGEVTGGVHGASRLGSVAIADCLTFGMIAGENI